MGGMVLGQFIGIIGTVNEAISAYNTRVNEGTEPLFDNVEERVLRICGKQSMATVTSMNVDGLHILPVFNDTKSPDVLSIVKQHSLKSNMPVYWHIQPEMYDTPHEYGWQWDEKNSLGMSRRWLIPTAKKNANGEEQRALIIEADGAFGDMSVRDSFGSFAAVTRMAEMCGAYIPTKDAIMRVFMVDPDQPEKSADGKSTIPLRDHEMNMADVLIDPQTLLVKEVLTRCAEVEKQNGRTKKLAVLNADKDIFDMVKARAAKFGWEIVDYHSLHADKHREERHPVIVWQPRIPSTLFMSGHLREVWKLKVEDMVAVAAHASGKKLLKNIIGQGHTTWGLDGLRFVSIPEIHDESFRWVRECIRKGQSAKEIQATLDEQISGTV
eukprot:NODE_7694_length_1557_cov_5.920280.p1 GENE.NODE_7694_length_1557_cov_5.920280~~NODE_7694_length_1557_cov_5.920280.p1  ORF type:complete len:421 (+),score=101.38 NODE_7694_length_1557_cov_5.920280:118-1263(+)